MYRQPCEVQPTIYYSPITTSGKFKWQSLPQKSELQDESPATQIKTRRTVNFWEKTAHVRCLLARADCRHFLEQYWREILPPKCAGYMRCNCRAWSRRARTFTYLYNFVKSVYFCKRIFFAFVKRVKIIREFHIRELQFAYAFNN